MPYSPRNIRIACDHAGLTHFGGVYFFQEFLRVLQLRNFLATHLTYPRRNYRYPLSQMILALVYPIILGLDRLETASFLRSNCQRRSKITQKRRSKITQKRRLKIPQ